MPVLVPRRLTSALLATGLIGACLAAVVVTAPSAPAATGKVTAIYAGSLADIMEKALGPASKRPPGTRLKASRAGQTKTLRRSRARSARQTCS